MSGRERWSLEALRGRQRAACEAFVDAHYRGVYGFFLWLTNDRDGAADAYREALRYQPDFAEARAELARLQKKPQP